MRERPLSAVPISAIILFVIALGGQLLTHHFLTSSKIERSQLPNAPTSAFYSLSGLGDTAASSKTALLWLQSFDMQHGTQVKYQHFDYDHLVKWLSSISRVDPDSSYPMLLASHIYANTPDPQQKRQMLDFVHQRFLENPNKHWRWMTHAATIARHQLEDLDLALKYAESLRRETSPDKVPGWARQMSIFLLDDMGESEAAMIILGGLLESGAITDQHERAFLAEKLKTLEKASQ